MGTLANPRHERFVQALFEGKTADAAYAKAGYKPNDGNCIRLKGNERVKARLAELQAQAAKKSEVTVQSLLAELETARERADSAEQFSAAVRAIEAKAKVSGVLTQKIEIGGPGDFDKCETTEAVAAKMLEDQCKFYPITDADREGLAKLMTRQFTEVSEYLASIKARPIVGSHPLTPQQQRTNERARQQRLGNPNWKSI
jgi:phage terminase small subunit